MVDRTAVVVGAGIGGLCAGLALRRQGWQVTILERAPAFGAVGAGIALFSNALTGLAALGVDAQIRAAGQVEAPGGTRTPDGRWLSRLDAADLVDELGTESLGIHRATLHEILLAALPEGTTTVTGAEVVEVVAGPPAEVTYVSGGARTTLRADLVVGADGLRSVVRRQLWPDTPDPVYVGATAWRGVTKQPWTGELLVGITWAPGAEFGMVPLGDGRVYWYGAVNAPVGQRAPDEMTAAREHFGSWHAPIPALLAATDPQAVLRNDLYHLGTPLHSYVTGAVALLGDAAHAMTPYLGQGAAQAVEDAVLLGLCLKPGTDVAAGLARYDAERRPRSQQVARASYQIGRIGQQLRNPLAVALRNVMIRLTPPRVALRSMARYADWRPPADLPD
ncbi:FAD-dependent monooxygenase [Plantactinospora endophytica]|uniref:FAD-dependent oxidoreductase n=1 Tax=Plantactinospora endophytica TaxID=673535 RepID=A0ABQ4DWL6_9ACTN|nr:FAD-dependent monooxygenase [Plantactinospora endophytica]GIG86848.1 FAD-dependent oxidoreductase [Plantactinospora endophytica]